VGSIWRGNFTPSSGVKDRQIVAAALCRPCFAVLEADGWNGLFVPAKTPREVIERLHREIAAAVKHPETAKCPRDLGAEPDGSSPAEQDASGRWISSARSSRKGS